MIRNIVFDVGKVLIDWYPKETMKELGFSDIDIEAISTAIFAQDVWCEEDRGILNAIQMEDFLVSKLPEYEDKIRLFYKHRTDSIRPRSYVHAWINTLKTAGYNVYVLSNFGEDAKDKGVAMGGIDFLSMLDGYIFSYEIHEVKPDAAIYHALADKYSLKLNECVFIDDLSINVEGAKAVGMEGIVFTSYDEACISLRELGVNL